MKKSREKRPPFVAAYQGGRQEGVPPGGTEDIEQNFGPCGISAAPNVMKVKAR
jgi:hypothetical protein